jgi:hypothetical protein
VKPQERIKFVNGVNQNPDGEISPGFQSLTNVNLQKLGSVEASKINATENNYGATTHSVFMGGLSTTEALFAGTGTNLKIGVNNIKTDWTGNQLESASLLNRVYVTDQADGLWSYKGGTSMFRAGAPVPTVGSFAAADGGGSGGFQGVFNLKVTFVNANGFEGNGSEAIASATLAADSDIDLANVPVNTDGDYSITSRKVYIQGGTTPTYSSYFLLTTINDNTTTSVSALTTSDVDTTTTLDTDNTLPLKGDYIAEHYNVMWLAGIVNDANSLRFSKTANPESWPTSNDINVSRSGDPIMWLTEWDGVLWVFTRARVFQIIGSPGSGTLITNFYIKETRSNKGTVAGRSVAHTPYGTFFLAEDGIRRFDGNTSTVFSNEIKDEIGARNSATLVEQLSCGAFWDDKYILSYASGSSTTNSRTVMYDFRAAQAGFQSPWTIHDSGYNDFAVDRAKNLLYCATSSGVERFREGSTYAGWVVEKEFPLPADRYYAWGKWQIDFSGSCSASLFLDGTQSQTYSLSNDTRSLLTRRFPSGLSQRATLKLTGAAKSTQDKVFSIAYSAEPQRGQP